MNQSKSNKKSNQDKDNSRNQFYKTIPIQRSSKLLSQKSHDRQTPQSRQINCRTSSIYSIQSSISIPEVIKCPVHSNEQVSYICKQRSHLYFCCSHCLKYHKDHLLIRMRKSHKKNQGQQNCIDKEILKKNCYQSKDKTIKMVEQLNQLKKQTISRIKDQLNKQFRKYNQETLKSFNQFFSMFQGSFNETQYQDFTRLVNNLTRIDSKNMELSNSEQLHKEQQSTQKVMKYIDKIKFMHNNQELFKINTIRETLQLGSYYLCSKIRQSMQKSDKMLKQTLLEFKNMTKLEQKLNEVKKQIKERHLVTSLHFKNLDCEISNKILRRMAKIQENDRIQNLDKKICNIFSPKQTLSYRLTIENSHQIPTFNQQILRKLNKLRKLRSIKFKNCIDYQSFGYIIDNRLLKPKQFQQSQINRIKDCIASQYKELYQLQQKNDSKLNGSDSNLSSQIKMQNKQQQENINYRVIPQKMNKNRYIEIIQNQSQSKIFEETNDFEIVIFKNQEIIYQDQFKLLVINCKRLKQLFIFGPTQLAYMGLDSPENQILNITQLTLVSVKISQAFSIKKIFSKFEKLQSLSSYYNDWISYQFIQTVSKSSKRLKRLSFFSNKNLENDSIRLLPRIKKIRYLFFGGQSKVENQVLVQFIKDCKSLKTVILHSLQTLTSKDSYELFQQSRQTLKVIKIVNCPNANTYEKINNIQIVRKQVESLVLKIPNTFDKILELGIEMRKYQTKKLTLKKSVEQLRAQQINQLIQQISSNFPKLQQLRLQSNIFNKQNQQMLQNKLPQIIFLRTSFDHGNYLKNNFFISQSHEEGLQVNFASFYVPKLIKTENLQIIIKDKNNFQSSPSDTDNIKKMIRRITNSQNQYKDLIFYVASPIEQNKLNQLIKCLSQKANPNSFFISNLAKPYQNKNQCKSILSLLKKYHNVQTLIVKRTQQFSDSLLAELSLSSQTISNLKHLHISHNHFIKAIKLPQFVNLKILVLNNCYNISSQAFLKAIQKFQKIQFIEINENFWVTDQIIQRIVKKYAKRLTHFGIKGNINISQQALLKIRQIRNLQYLNCGKTKMSHNILVQISKQCTKLSKLGLCSLKNIQQNTLPEIAKHIRIQQLDISFSQRVNDQSLFGIVKHLKWIKTQGSGVSYKMENILQTKNIHVVGQKEEIYSSQQPQQVSHKDYQFSDNS